MKTKILIGSILVLTLLLLMPSIPAIQQKTIEDRTYDDIVEKLDEINLEDLAEIKDLDLKRPPLLYLFVISILFIQVIRGEFFFNIMLECMEAGELPGTFHITHPILWVISTIRAAWFFGFCMQWVIFWDSISESFGWNWNINPF